MLPTKEAKEERDDLIYADFMNNVAVTYLAKKNKLSVARIHQIITKYRNDPKLADRSFDRSHKEEEELVRTVNRTPKKTSNYMTTVSIEGFGTLPFKASPEDIIQTLKDKFSTNLDKLMEMINTGKIDEAKAARILNFLTKPPFEEVYPRKQATLRQTEESESELANEPNPEDRMKGISFGGI